MNPNLTTESYDDIYGDSIEDKQQKHTYDLYYVKHATLSLDLHITPRTIGAAMQGTR